MTLPLLPHERLAARHSQVWLIPLFVPTQTKATFGQRDAFDVRTSRARLHPP